MSAPRVVKGASGRGTGSASYWDLSRAPRHSLVFVIPLFLLYEALALGLANEPAAAGVRNAADVLLKSAFLLIGPRGLMVFLATVTGVCVWLVARDIGRSRQPPRPRVFLLMLAESAVLALLLGVVVGTLTTRLLQGLSALAAQQAVTPLEQMPWDVKLMLSLGAGLYEELLFRVLLVGGLALAFRWLLGGGRAPGSILAAVVGALLFSLFHHVGAYGETFELTSFTYRTIAGLAFSGLYLTRGFGITAWTHALYDVYVLILLA